MSRRSDTQCPGIGVTSAVVGFTLVRRLPDDVTECRGGFQTHSASTAPPVLVMWQQRMRSVLQQSCHAAAPRSCAGHTLGSPSNNNKSHNRGFPAPGQGRGRRGMVAGAPPLTRPCCCSRRCGSCACALGWASQSLRPNDTHAVSTRRVPGHTGKWCMCPAAADTLASATACKNSRSHYYRCQKNNELFHLGWRIYRAFTCHAHRVHALRRRRRHHQRRQTNNTQFCLAWRMVPSLGSGDHACSAHHRSALRRRR